MISAATKLRLWKPRVMRSSSCGKLRNAKSAVEEETTIATIVTDKKSEGKREQNSRGNAHNRVELRWAVSGPPTQSLYSDFRRDPLGHKRFNRVTTLNVVIVADCNAALHAVANFAGIILEALQRANLSFVHLNAIADQAHVRIAFDGPILHIASGHRANLGYAEDVPHRRPAHIGFLDDGFEQAGHGFLDLVLKLINDGVQANIHLLHISQLLRFALRTHAETDNHRVRSGCQQHVILGDRAHAGMQDLDFYLLRREFGQGICQHL